VVRVAYWIAPAVVGLLVAGLTTRSTSALIRSASLRASSLWHLADSFKLAASASCSAPLLLDIRAHIESGEGAYNQLRRLERITRLGEVRYSDLLHFVLHALCLLDLHVALRFERWREASGPYVHSWFTALGEMEALCCLAELADGHSAWAFPTIREAGGPTFVATAVAHPLLAPGTAVPNDVRIEPRRFLFVTGSNMSGKSTLLRAIGVNAILGRMGGPVCAASLELTASEIFTYVHVTDSLLDGVSGFMAGLLRLKAVVERAGRVHDDESTLLFLLDEPLQGTNPAERQLAIRRILRSLLGVGASGAITSHDLSLIDTDDLSRLASAVHFDERLDTHAAEQSLVFDYRLRPGVCSSTNAIRLLDALGFPENG
jgi:DNA mismatch repair ATPase MutS